MGITIQLGPDPNDLGQMIRAGAYGEERRILYYKEQEQLALIEKITQLAGELALHHNNNKFLQCTTMPQVTYLHLKELLMADHKQSSPL